jgi:hypothetical protein
MATLMAILMNLAKPESSQPGRVFLMDVEDELAEVEEEFYESYRRRRRSASEILFLPLSETRS